MILNGHVIFCKIAPVISAPHAPVVSTSVIVNDHVPAETVPETLYVISDPEKLSCCLLREKPTSSY
jgi:hypothetical protein